MFYKALLDVSPPRIELGTHGFSVPISLKGEGIESQSSGDIRRRLIKPPRVIAWGFESLILRHF